GLINQFKLVFDGIKLPSGHYYSASEGANGELGFFILSSGETKPYRLKLRPPCFYALNAFSKMVEGSLIADSILNLGSLNIIAGELDR
ncbi:MAG: NADH-quinone oxidoreductase subunit C, partial [Campylobacter hyointestinalis]